jgi:plastocyanin
MIKAIFVTIGVLAVRVAGAPATVEDVATVSKLEAELAAVKQELALMTQELAALKALHPEDNVVANETESHRRELFPVYALGTKCARRGCSIYHQISAVNPTMSLSNKADRTGVKGPVKALEMLALNDDLNTVISSDSYCTRRAAMSRAAGLAAGLALATVNAPGFAAEAKSVKMGSDNGQLVFVPDSIKICKGDTVTWVNNKGGPHNVVFDEEAIPAGVDQEKISMDGQLGEEGEKFSMKFDTAGKYSYYCEPHRGAGMNGEMEVA